MIRHPAATRRGIATLLGVAVLAPILMPAGAVAQPWPARPVRIVIGAPPGGSVDTVARLLAAGMQKEWRQAVIVEARPGAAGTIGVSELLASPPDGHTLLVAPDAQVTEVPHAIRVRYDPFKDLKPLAELSRSGLVFVGNPAVPASDVAEVVAYAKANPGKVSYASFSSGTVSHRLGLELNRAAGIDMVHVPYRGSPPALQDVIAGHVPLMFDGPATSIPMIKAGRIKAFAVSGPKRLAALPDVRTFAEQGFAQFDDVAWLCLWIHPDVPAAVQAKVRDAALKAMAQPEVHARLAELGSDSGTAATPEDLARTLRQAHERHRVTLRALGVEPP